MRTLRTKPDALPERRGIEHAAACDDSVNPTRVVDVVERVAIEHDEIATLAGLDRAAVRLRLHRSCRNDRRRLKRLQRGEARPHVQLELAVETVAGDGLIRSGDDWDAG